MSKDWSAFDVSKGARTTDEIEKKCKLSKAKCLSCSEVPIFKFIPIDHMIIDTLHLFLRVSDLLINLLIQDLRRQDGIANATLNREKRVKSYETFLNTAKNTLGGTHRNGGISLVQKRYVYLRILIYLSFFRHYDMVHCYRTYGSNFGGYLMSLEKLTLIQNNYRRT
jgi:hypothetical protein